MAYSTPLTAVANAALTAAQWNASVRDNILETAVAKATAAGQYFVSTAANTLAARTASEDQIGTAETTTSTSYTDLTTVGPSITKTTSIQALVWINCLIYNTTTSNGSYVACDVSGATTSAASDARALVWQGTASQGERWGNCTLFSLTAGSNTFKMMYKVDATTGQFEWRREQVMAF